MDGIYDFTISSGGSGYSEGDTLSVDGGTTLAYLEVTSVDAGEVTGLKFHLNTSQHGKTHGLNRGSGYVPSPTPVPTTTITGNGTGLEIIITELTGNPDSAPKSENLYLSSSNQYVSGDYLNDAGNLVGVIPDNVHGNKTAPDLHAVATQTEAGFMSAQDKSDLDELMSTGSGAVRESRLVKLGHGIEAEEGNAPDPLKPNDLDLTTDIKFKVSNGRGILVDETGVLIDDGIVLTSDENSNIIDNKNITLNSNSGYLSGTGTIFGLPTPDQNSPEHQVPNKKYVDDLREYLDGDGLKLGSKLELDLAVGTPYVIDSDGKLAFDLINTSGAENAAFSDLFLFQRENTIYRATRDQLLANTYGNGIEPYSTSNVKISVKAQTSKGLSVSEDGVRVDYSNMLDGNYMPTHRIMMYDQDSDSILSVPAGDMVQLSGLPGYGLVSRADGQDTYVDINTGIGGGISVGATAGSEISLDSTNMTVASLATGSDQIVIFTSGSPTQPKIISKDVFLGSLTSVLKRRGTWSPDDSNPPSVGHVVGDNKNLFLYTGMPPIPDDGDFSPDGYLYICTDTGSVDLQGTGTEQVYVSGDQAIWTLDFNPNDPDWDGTTTLYSSGTRVKHNSYSYVCILDHDASAIIDDEPGTGNNWTTYWRFVGEWSKVSSGSSGFQIFTPATGVDRTGTTLVATVGDYKASMITNDSGFISGNTLADAFENVVSTSGNQTIGGSKIFSNNVQMEATPISAKHLVTMGWVNSSFLRTTGGNLTGALNITGNNLIIKTSDGSSTTLRYGNDNDGSANEFGLRFGGAGSRTQPDFVLRWPTDKENLRVSSSGNMTVSGEIYSKYIGLSNKKAGIEILTDQSTMITSTKRLTLKEAEISPRFFDGTTWYDMYHEGNTPTADQIGALRLSQFPTYTTQYAGVSNTATKELLDYHGNTLSRGEYKVRLVTAGTGTMTGAIYIVNISESGTAGITDLWHNGYGSNHPELRIVNGKVHVATRHTSGYTVIAYVTSVQDNENTNLFGYEKQLYSVSNKPTATEIGALPLTGGTLTGTLNIGSNKLIVEGKDVIGVSGNLCRFGDAAGGSAVRIITNSVNNLSVQVGSNLYKVYNEGSKPTASDIGLGNLYRPSTGVLSWTSPSGETTIGMLNTTWNHYHTTASNGHYFYKSVNIQSGLTVGGNSSFVGKGVFSGNVDVSGYVYVAAADANPRLHIKRTNLAYNVNMAFEGSDSVKTYFGKTQDGHFAYGNNVDVNGAGYKIYSTGNKPTYNDVGISTKDIISLSGALGTTDLNSLTSSGFHFQNANANATTARHYPTAQAGSLLVQKAAGVTQTYTTYGPSRTAVYVRSYYNGSWGNWIEMYSTLNKPTPAEIGAIPITGGSVSGNLSVGGSFSAARISLGLDPGTNNSIGCSGWFRSSGNTGWYNPTYNGGIYMTDSTYVKVYNSKAFYVDNQIIATGNVQAYYSDARLKDITEELDTASALEAVCKWKKVRYTANETAHELGGYDTKKKEIGLLAQEIEEDYPELTSLAPFDHEVKEDGEIVSKSGENYKTLDYERVITVQAAAIEELNKKIEALTKRLDDMQ